MAELLWRRKPTITFYNKNMLIAQFVFTTETDSFVYDVI